MDNNSKCKKEGWEAFMEVGDTLGADKSEVVVTKEQYIAMYSLALRLSGDIVEQHNRMELLRSTLDHIIQNS